MIWRSLVKEHKMLIAGLAKVLAAIWHAKRDQSFAAVCLFSLLGLTLTMAFPGLMTA